jgi:glycolate oxidase iron-sulfur subunit
VSGAREAAAERGGLAGALARNEELLGHCVHCGFCLPVCPTYQELGDEADSPRGRLHLMRAVVEGRLDADSDAFQRHMDRCLGCRACESVCPSGVEYGFLLEHARAVAGEARPPARVVRALLATMARPAWLRLFGLAGRLGRATGIPAVGARILPGDGVAGRLRLALAMLAASAPASLPEPRTKGVRPAVHLGVGAAADHVRAGPVRPGESKSQGPSRPGVAPRGRVALLRGCIQDQLFRRVNEATRLVLEVNGWEVVEVGDQGCCGALHAHAGDLEGAHALGVVNHGAFGAVHGLDFVVVNAAGCGAHLRQDPDPALKGRVRDVSEVLAGEGRTPRPGAPLALEVAYDPPCHLLHAQGVDDPPRALLASIPGLTLVPLADADRCCGGAGIYGLTHPELGGAIGGAKVRAIVESGARVVATGNPGCQMQIGAGLRMAGAEVEVLHPVELLAESYRRAGWST